MDYFKADEEMVELCRELVEKHHPDLDGASIAIICKDKAGKSKGQKVLANVSLVSKRFKPLLADEYDFVICVAQREWDYLEENQRRALLDHELCHCVIDADGPALVGHDFEEFACIVARHGFWTESPVEEKMKQAVLFSQGVKVEAPELTLLQAAGGEV